MAKKPHVEFEFEDASGNLFPLELTDRLLTRIAGLGMPPVRHWTTRSPFQHGRSHWGYAFQPRVVTVGLLLRACDRDGYWDKRKANVGMFNPMNGPLKLRLTRPDRHVYELHDGWYQAGYELEATDLDDPWSIEGASQVEFEDPFWKWTTAPLSAGQTRDSDGRVCSLTVTFTTQSNLVLPFSGPFLLGTETGTADVGANNAGTWEALPVITITGPLSDWTLTNDTNGKQISWNNYVIDDGEIVTIDIPEKTVVNDDGLDLRSYLSGDSATFSLAPGDNDVTFWAADLEDGLYPNWPIFQMCWYVEVLGT